MIRYGIQLAETQKRSGNIRATFAYGSRRKRKVSYFFRVLQDLIERRGA